MKYLMVSWIHDFDDEPILLYHEIDDSGYEKRKIEVYKDESFGIASSEQEFGGSALSDGPFPSIEEIGEDTQFLPKNISKDEFEDVWTEYTNFLKRVK